MHGNAYGSVPAPLGTQVPAFSRRSIKASVAAAVAGVFCVCVLIAITFESKTPVIAGEWESSLLMTNLDELRNGALACGSNLLAGEGLKNDKGAVLIMQNDGNLVLYNSAHRALWSSGTHGNAGSRFEVQSDGNLVVYKKSGQPIWNSRTHGKGPNCELQLQNDCNIVLYRSNSAGTYGPRDAVWASRTHC